MSALLAQAGIDTGGEFDWTRVLLVESQGTTAPAGADVEPRVWTRGFNLVILAKDGSPRYYCKGRPVHPQGIHRRESIVLSSFAANAATRSLVTETRIVHDDRLELRVSRYLGGDRFDGRIPRFTLDGRYNAVSTVLEAAACLSVVARSDEAVMLHRDPHVILADAAAPSVSLLGSMGTGAADADTLARALHSAGSVTALPQHRDLWPANVVIMQDDSVRIIDFDEYGEVVIPLYDACHFMRTTDDQARSADGRPWLDRLLDEDPDGAAMRRILRREAQRWELDSTQTAGCLVYYLLDFAAWMFRRRVPERFWCRFRDELPVAAARIRDAGSLDAFADLLIPDCTAQCV